MTTITKAAVAVALLFGVACNEDKVPTVTVEPSQAFCPTAFTWNYVDSAYNYEEHSQDILTNTYKLTFAPDSLVEGTGSMTVELAWRDGANSGVAVVKVLWPFLGYYKERDGIITIYYGDIWLARDDVRIRRFGGGLVVESLNPDIELHMLWEKC